MDYQDKSKFLLQNNQFLRCRVSLYFPLTFQELIRYRDVLHWDCLAFNRNIPWSIQIVDEFRKELWNKDGIYPEFNINPSVPWSIDFIERYIDEVNWELLAQNEKVVKKDAILYHFAADFAPHQEMVEVYRSDVEDDFFENMDRQRRLVHPELSLKEAEDIESLDYVDWSLLSQNTYFKWDLELILRYEQNWNWYELELNEAIPWDSELIGRFEDKLSWPMPVVHSNGDTSHPSHGICTNQSIAWTREMLERYRYKLDSTSISCNKVIPWDFGIVSSLYQELDHFQLAMNDNCWNRVFPEFDKRKNLLPLLDALRAQQLN